jgi:hypothetical protein
MEVRIHSGTVNSDKIINWVKLLVKIADCQNIKRFPVTLNSVSALLGLDLELRNYVAERIRLFNGGESLPFLTKKKRKVKANQVITVNEVQYTVSASGRE